MLNTLRRKLLATRIAQRLLAPFFAIDDKVAFFTRSMQFLKGNEVNGDYLEFGCFRGRTFVLAHKYMHLAGLKMKLYGFDSFQGVPEPKGVDTQSVLKGGDQAVGIEDFRAMVKIEGLKDAEYALIPGFYSDSLKTNAIDKIGIKLAAMIYIDCVLYESTVTVLEYVLPVLQTGTIIAFDDYYYFKGDPERGEQLALKEFLEKNSEIKLLEYLNIGWHGKSFIVKKYNS